MEKTTVLRDAERSPVEANGSRLSAVGGPEQNSRPYAMRRYKYLDALIVAFVVVLLVSNLVAQKICQIGPFKISGVMARIAATADSTREEWDRVIGINLRGVWSCMKHELRHMERQGSGAIVNNASVGALTGNPGIGSYIASKHGIVGLTRTAALEYIKHGIRVNAINPGLIDTQIARDVVSGDGQAYSEIAESVPIGRAGRPEATAESA